MHCYFCERGARRRGLLPPLTDPRQVPFISVERFEQVLYHLLENNIIAADTSLALYNWGEPLIHPRIKEILTVIKNCSLFKGSLALSTNGSKELIFSRDFMPDLPTSVVFTIPGFSQHSYDRCHGFNFDKTMHNIASMAASLRGIGIAGLTLTYLVFKYNISELKLAQAFASKHKLYLSPVIAYFNSQTLVLKYIKNTFSDEEKQLVDQSLILDIFELRKKLRPANYECPQFSYLAISPEGQVNLGCCARLDAPEDYFLGDVCQMNLEEIYSVKEKKPICALCREYALDYFLHTSPSQETGYIEQHAENKQLLNTLKRLTRFGQSAKHCLTKR